MNGGAAGEGLEQVVPGDLSLLAARSKLQLIGAGLSDASREHETARVAHIEYIARLELPLNCRDAHRQKRRTALDERPSCPVVHRNRAMGRIAECDPKLARSDVRARMRWHEERARSASAPSSAPLQITLGMPAVMRIRLLRILVIIPPVPTALDESPAEAMIAASIFSTRGTKRALGSMDGFAV